MTEEPKTAPEKPKSRWFRDFEAAIPSQLGKIVIITGTTSGTGLVAAHTALKKGATVAVLNRNVEKAKKASEEFFEKEPEAKERIHYVNCDLQSFESVRNAAAEVTDMFQDQGIDVLVNNAGVMALEDKGTADGYDVQMQTNHLSHFMLTRMLFPLLDKRASEKGEARVVNHSSLARIFPFARLQAKYFGKNGGNLGGNGNSMGLIWAGGRWERYHQTKLANSVFTSELQRRLEIAGSKVMSLCAHPGLAATELQVTTHKEGGMTDLGMMRNAQSAEDGTMGLLRCMFGQDVENGALYGPLAFTGQAEKRWHGILNSRSAGTMLWEESEKACGEFKI